MALRRCQAEHDWMVHAVAKHFGDSGYTDIRADLPNCEARPGMIVRKEDGHRDRPDATARDGKRLIVAEVETEDTIADAHTKKQWPLFADHVKEHGGAFWLVIRSGAVGKTEARLRSLGIAAEIKVVST